MLLNQHGKHVCADDECPPRTSTERPKTVPEKSKDARGKRNEPSLILGRPAPEGEVVLLGLDLLLARPASTQCRTTDCRCSGQTWGWRLVE